MKIVSIFDKNNSNKRVFIPLDKIVYIKELEDNKWHICALYGGFVCSSEDVNTIIQEFDD